MEIEELRNEINQLKKLHLDEIFNLEKKHQDEINQSNIGNSVEYEENIKKLNDQIEILNSEIQHLRIENKQISDDYESKLKEITSKNKEKLINEIQKIQFFQESYKTKFENEIIQ